ncbi:hypothetical protein DFH28DRAFT_1153434 [Melampsora americana]|nr:hypothetical protein DFH28DRAFT_1153434 [Melampsora americana]
MTDSEHARPTPRYIKSLPQRDGPPRYQCTVCGGHTMKDFHSHVKSVAHHTAAEAFVAQQQADLALRQRFHTRPRSPTPSVEPQHQHNYFDLESDLSDPPSPPPSPFTILCNLENPDPFGVGYDSDFSNDAMNFDSLRQAFEVLGNEHEEGEARLDEELLEEDIKGVQPQDSDGWYPFKRKEHVVALLMIGSNRNLLSRMQYQRIRSILRIMAVNLPEWGTLRALVKRMKKTLGLMIRERKSPLGNPLFGLDVKIIISNELANPLVSPHLVFVPERTLEGPTNRLSQCKKWREDYSPELRVQMIVSNDIHYYIYEPVQLQTQQLVVPIFFFQQDNCLMARCLPAIVIPDPENPTNLKVLIPEVSAFNSEQLFTIECKDFWRTLPKIELDGGKLLKDLCGDFMYYLHDVASPSRPIQNKWRAKAAGKVIRHVPISLYSDDTSGNVSKKWNKHMCIYFTLAGLPPHLTNQEFNIHFLATSNCATALELFDQVVDDLNDHGENGFIAYDHTLGAEVWVMPVVLCHLGDSPMHAEITNTLNPANTLNPCRMCDLSVNKQAEKESDLFVSAFLGLDSNGNKCLLPARDWNLTSERTKELWTIAQKRNTKSRVEALCRKYGIRDPVNEVFQKKVQAAHSAISSSENEQVEKLCHDLIAEFGDRLFNPMLRLKGFNGHLDTPVEILHVVLLGIAKYLYRDSMKDLGNIKVGSKMYNDLSGRWRSVNTKGLNVPPIQPNVFVSFYQSLTEIPDMTIYLAELDIMIDRFLNNLVSLNARWVNKPKFHMLIHLHDSIRRFGPASLFATEKFESFNGIVRHASVHSNHHSPGQDIANSFNTLLMLRLFISGSSFFDHHLQTRVFGGPQLQELLSRVPELYQALGLDKDLGLNSKYIIGALCANQTVKPQCLMASPKYENLLEFKSINLSSGQKVEKNDFVHLKDSNLMGQVQSLWKVQGESDSKTLVVLKVTQKGRMLEFYGMREICITEEIVLNKIQCVINIQHNCHEAQCSVAKNRLKNVERKSSSISTWGVQHVDYNSYVINGASQYSSKYHRKASDFIFHAVTPEDWKEAVSQGLNQWKAEPRPQKRGKQVETDAPVWSNFI